MVGVVAMTSGVSFAATGHVPFSDTLKKVTHAVTGQQPVADQPTDGDRSHRGGNGKADPQGPKAAALQGLCRAYAHGKKSDHGTSHATRPSQMLVTAAGGEDQVADFCASLPAKAHRGQSAPTHPVHPTHPTHPTHPAHPTQSADPGNGNSSPGDNNGNGPSANSSSNGNHGTGNNGNDPTKPTHPTHPTHPAEPTKQPKPTRGNTPAKPTHTGKPSSAAGVRA